MPKKIIRITAIFLVFVISAVFAVPAVFDSVTSPPDIPSPENVQTSGELWNIVDTSKAEYTYSEMVDDLGQLAEKGEGRFTYTAVGDTLDGRKIYAAVLGEPSAKKQILVSAGIHAREYMTPLLVMKQIEYYLCNYDTGEYNGIRFSDLFSEYAFCVLPMCNPDGITLVQAGIDSLRSDDLREKVREIYETDKSTTSDFADMSLNEYLKYWKANARGVDINRNFDTPAWVKNNVHKPCFTDCRGEMPSSEPETRAMTSYVETLSNPVCSIAVHSRGEIIYFDCGQNDAAPSLTLAQLVGGINGYSVSYNEKSVAAFDDWCIIRKNIPSVTVETGISSCPLPIGEFQKIWNDNKDLWVAVASSGKY